MKVTRITHIITGLEGGGAQAILYTMCQADTSVAHRVIALGVEDRYAAPLRDLGIDVTCLGMRRGRPSLSGLLQLRSLIKAERPDLVQTWMYHADLIGGLAARLAGHRRIVWGIHQAHLDPAFIKRSTIAVARLNGRLSRFVPARVILCASSARETHIALGYAERKLRVVQNGYDFSRFAPDETAAAALRATWQIPNDVPVLGNVSRYYPQKDHETLLSACGHLHREGLDFRLVLVGEGLDSDNQALTTKIAQEKLTEKVLLQGKRTDIPAVMSVLDIHVLSSRTEAFPNVLNEAMACGTPCVTTDVGDAADIVGETGWVVPSADPHALSEAIRSAVITRQASSGDWQHRCEAGRNAVVTRFGLDRMIAGYHAIWREAGLMDLEGSDYSK